MFLSYMWKRRLFLITGICSLILLHLAILAKTQFIDWPELLLYPWLTSQGFALYTDLFIPYQPLVIGLLRFAFSFLGYTLTSYRLIHLFIVSAIDVVLGLIIYRTTRSYLVACVGIILYLLWQPTAEGGGIWFDHFLIVPLALAYYFTLQTIKNERSWLASLYAGMSLGTALIIKQQAVVFFGFFLSFPIMTILLKKKPLFLKQFISIPTVALVFPCLQLVYFLIKNKATEYLFWVYTFGINLRDDPNYVIPPNFHGDLPFVLLFISVFVLLVLLYQQSHQHLPLLFSSMWIFSAVLLLFPRWTLTHMQTPLFFLVVLLAQLFSVWLGKKQNILALMVIIMLWLLSFKMAKYYLTQTTGNEPRFYNRSTQTSIDDIQKIKGAATYFLFGNTEYWYVYLGETPQIKPYVQLFPWNTQIPNLQEKLVQELKTLKPKYIFRQSYHLNKPLFNGKSPQKLDFYLFHHYTLREKVGDIEVFIQNTAN